MMKPSFKGRPTIIPNSSQRQTAARLILYLFFPSAEAETTTYLSQASAVCTLRLHVNQVPVEVFKFFHCGLEGHNLAGGVCRGVHLCPRHPATAAAVTWREKVENYNHALKSTGF